MATFRRMGTIGQLREKFISGMLERGYENTFAESCFSQIEGFGEYGFPESHAAAFAMLAYVSAWLKCHHPAAFACALLNSQPMGFYAPAQIVRDAREHHIEVRPICVNTSDWDNTLEKRSDGSLVRSKALERKMPRGSLPPGAMATLIQKRFGYGQVCRLRCWSAWPKRMPIRVLEWGGAMRFGL